MILSMRNLIVTLKIKYTQHSVFKTLNITHLIVILKALNIIDLIVTPSIRDMSVAFSYCHAECRYAECYYAESLYDECRGTAFT